MEKQLRDAYFAGLIDGEGYIGIKQAGTHKRPQKKLEIKVNMTCYKTVLALRDHFEKGNVRPRKAAPGCKPQWVWSVTCRAAREVLDVIRPYLITKAEAVRLVDAHQLLRAYPFPKSLASKLPGAKVER
jgi:hypothetical protein